MTDRLALDHLVYGVPDLENAIDDFETRLGLVPVFGGRHQGLGTHNAIVPLTGETYLELIASDPDGPMPSRPRPFGLDALRTPRIVAWAVRSRAIEDDVERACDQGFDPGRVLRMTRKEPDGEKLHWKLSLRQEPFGDGLVPFLIDWGNTRHPAAGARPSLDGMPDGTPRPRCQLASFSAYHPDPEPIQAALGALGARLSIQPGTHARLNARLIGPAGFLDLGNTN